MKTVQTTRKGWLPSSSPNKVDGYEDQALYPSHQRSLEQGKLFSQDASAVQLLDGSTGSFHFNFQPCFSPLLEQSSTAVPRTLPPRSPSSSSRRVGHPQGAGRDDKSTSVSDTALHSPLTAAQRLTGATNHAADMLASARFSISFLSAHGPHVMGQAHGPHVIGQPDVPRPANASTDLLQDFAQLLRAFQSPEEPEFPDPDGTRSKGSGPDQRNFFPCQKRHHDFLDGGFGGLTSKRSRGAEQQEVVRLTLEEMYFGTVKSVPVHRQILDEDSGCSIGVDEEVWFNVQPGVEAGSRIRLPGRGSEVSDGVRGRTQDLVLVVEQTHHPRFERLGNYLITQVDVDLKTALCGGSVQVQTLDDRDLQVALKGVTKPNSQVVVPGEGMPVPRCTDKKGDLLINIDVRFPKQLSPLEKAQVAALLPRD